MVDHNMRPHNGGPSEGHEPSHTRNPVPAAVAARVYIKFGFYPIPIPHKQKAPVLKGWQDLRLGLGDVEQHFGSGRHNVGLLLGASGLVDIDLDTAEAAALAPLVLPITATFGRPSKPRSHWIYRVEKRSPTVRYQSQDGDGTVTHVEYRDLTRKGTPVQTVVPDSTHPSGERITWDGPGLRDLATLEVGELGRRVRHLAGLSAIARLWAKREGGRHDAAGALASTLTRSGVSSYTDVAEVVGAIADAAGDEESADRERFARDTVEAMKENPNAVTTGIPRLKALLCRSESESATLEKALGWLGFKLSPNLPAPIPGAPFDWEAPRPIAHPGDRFPAPSFDPAWLPSRVRAWCEDIARRMQVPLDLVAAAALVMLGTAVGRRVAVRPKRHDDWTVVPNLWGGVVARPGQKKSPVLKEVLSPLRGIQAEAHRAFEDEMRRYEAEVQAEEVRTQASKQAAKRALREDAETDVSSYFGGSSAPEMPRRTDYIVHDATPEALVEIARANPDGFLQLRDELAGLIARLDSPSAGEERSLYLTSWNGADGYSHSRIGRGHVRVEALCQSILGGIQPDKLDSLVLGATRGSGGGDGLLQRFQILVFPDPTAEYVHVDEWPDNEAKRRAHDLVRGLVRLDPPSLGAEEETAFDGEPKGVWFLRFAEDAQPEFDRWITTLETRLRNDEMHPAFESHLAKYRSLVPSLALVYHLADGQKGPVSKGALDRSVATAHYLEAHALKVYGSAESPELASSRTLGRKLLAGELGDSFTVRDLYRKGWTGLSTKEPAQAAVDVLVDHGWVREEVATKGSRTFTRYVVNPAIRTASREELLPLRRGAVLSRTDG